MFQSEFQLERNKMPAKWNFKELRPGDKDRQPTQGEFFATDAIRTPAEALVRETIQNSLDARVPGANGPVRVRFRLSTGKDALPASVARRYFEDGWIHFSSDGNGLDDVPKNSDDCPFLVTEDFGTTGLIGEVDQWRHISGRKNPFYYFFRTEGRSGKGEEDRGRWGIGKYVFPRSSRINSFIALTVRCDDAQSLLMGQAILKSHSIGERYFTPDGDYGVLKDNGLVLPVADKDFLAQFSSDFNLSRTTEPGLSVVVPWVSPDITKENLLKAVVEDYFYPILAGGLEVILATGDDEIGLSKDNLESTSMSLGEEFAAHMLPLIVLARWANDENRGASERLVSPSAQRPVWESAMIPPDRLVDLRNKFRSGEKMAITVPLLVREHKRAARESHFNFYLVNDAGDNGTPVFIRDGITISDVRTRFAPGVRSLVIVDDKPLATLLGDSENPAHTQWQKDREHFAGKYVFGKSYIDFVSHSVAMFVRILNEADQEPDRDLLRDIFFVPKQQGPQEKKEKSKPRKRNKGAVIDPKPVVEPRKRRFTLSKVAGGFTISPGAKDALPPVALRVEIAYDRRRGSALKKYVPADFRTDEEPIRIELEGAKIVEKSRNIIVAKILAPNFRVMVGGFDENRDLFVDVEAQDLTDDSQT